MRSMRSVSRALMMSQRRQDSRVRVLSFRLKFSSLYRIIGLNNGRFSFDDRVNPYARAVRPFVRYFADRTPNRSPMAQ